MQIKNINGEYVEADIVRYFNINDTDYLIYSLGETDEAGYVRLYASKMIENRACIISDPEEWQGITQIIKETVRNNRDGNELNLMDLNENKLTDIILQDTRIFKLQGNLVTLLSENKNVVENEVEESLEQYESEIEEEIIEENIDFETMYTQQLEKNNILQASIESLEEEVQKYKEKLDKIKDMIEND